MTVDSGERGVVDSVESEYFAVDLAHLVEPFGPEGDFTESSDRTHSPRFVSTGQHQCETPVNHAHGVVGQSSTLDRLPDVVHSCHASLVYQYR